MEKVNLLIALGVGLFLGSILVKHMKQNPQPQASCNCSK